MNSITCKNCGLKNFPLDTECKRCGYSFVAYRRPKGKKPRSFSIWSLLMIAIVVGLVYYFYDGVQSSMQEIEANEAKRIKSQPDVRPGEAGLSRTQTDQRRVTTYGDAVKNSSSLSAHQQRVKETEKAVQQISNTSNK
jgi:hypothetical protein